MKSERWQVEAMRDSWCVGSDSSLSQPRPVTSLCLHGELVAAVELLDLNGSRWHRSPVDLSRVICHTSQSVRPVARGEPQTTLVYQR